MEFATHLEAVELHEPWKMKRFFSVRAATDTLAQRRVRERWAYLVKGCALCKPRRG